MKKLSCIILNIAVIMSMTACDGKTDDRSEAGFDPHLDTKTNCSITVAGSYDNFEALEAEFDRFNEIYPDVRMSYLKLDDYNNTIGMALSGKGGPDIFFSYAWMIGNSKYDTVFSSAEDLSDPKLSLDLDCIRSGLVNHDAEGHVLMVPIFSRTYGMLVNTDLFKKEGLEVPDTWTELLDVCGKFRDRGYASPMMGYSHDPSSCFMNTVAYPCFTATLASDKEALKLTNDLSPAAGEYMRPALNTVEQLIENGCIDLSACDKIEDNYTQVILRFFEGDVPMMICTGDTVSGTRKRESQSEAFTKSPFEYRFYPVPCTDEGGYFIDSPSVEFSVNKNCDDPDMTNEFMRFLITDTELNNMASLKRLVTPAADMSFDPVYAPFGQMPSDRILSPEVLGITDPLTVQIRAAAFRVGKGELTVDEAVAMYGSFE